MHTFRDGVISKEEMTQYFLGAYQSLKRIFKHNFQECSYLSPTYCDHCKGRLIGYVRQGYKCKGECDLYIVSLYTLIKVTIISELQFVDLRQGHTHSCV